MRRDAMYFDLQTIRTTVYLLFVCVSERRRMYGPCVT